MSQHLNWKILWILSPPGICVTEVLWLFLCCCSSCVPVAHWLMCYSNSSVMALWLLCCRGCVYLGYTSCVTVVVQLQLTCNCLAAIVFQQLCVFVLQLLCIQGLLASALMRLCVSVLLQLCVHCSVVCVPAVVSPWPTCKCVDVVVCPCSCVDAVLCSRPVLMQLCLIVLLQL